MKISVKRKAHRATTAIVVRGWVVARPAGRRAKAHASVQVYLVKADAVDAAGTTGRVRPATLLVGVIG